MPERSYTYTTPIDGHRSERTICAQTLAKARYQVLLNAWDAGYEISFKHVKMRYGGKRATPTEIHARKVAQFNRLYPRGTPVRVYPWTLDDEDKAYDTTVAAGAFVYGEGASACLCVMVERGGWIAMDHVFPLTANREEQ